MNNLEFKLDDAIDLIEEVIENGGEFRLFPMGFSMRPLIVQGRDSVVLRRNKTCPASKHDIAFYRRDDGQFVLHRVMKIGKDGLYTMCGDGQYVYERGIRKEQIIAYVSDIYRGEKRFSVSSPRYRLYVFFWTKMPLRKAIHKIRCAVKGKK